MTDAREIGVELTLAELEERYAWVGEALAAAHTDGKIESGGVRFFIKRDQPLLLDESGDPILDADGDLQYDWSTNPFFYGVAQAYSLLGPPLIDRNGDPILNADHSGSQSVAGESQLPLGLLDQAECNRGLFLDILCSDLNEYHARELADATGA
jgi:hypothetical protein